MRKFLFVTLFFFGAYFTYAQNQPKLDCSTDYEWQEQVKKYPELLQAQRHFEEEFVKKVKINYNPDDYKVKSGSGKKSIKYIIPVVVHVFHANGSENLSDAAVINTIANMNKYYSGTVSNIGSVRSVFKNLIADCEIEFRLAKKDPNGNCTNGIIRIYTPQTYRGNDLIKGLSAWDTKRYLNIWVCNAVYSGATAVGGYANLPFGGSLSSKNGVILVAGQFVSDNVGAHEAGHWLGLYHPFQSNDSCSSSNDEIDDTPPTFFKMSTNGVNTGRGNFCGNVNYNTCTVSTPVNTSDLPDMQENVMDYFSGSCSGLMFTLQQKARMIFCLENFRQELITQDNLLATGTNDASVSDCAPIAAFNTKTQVICAGASTTFFDFSYNASSITSYNWEFEGGTPNTFSGKTPTQITYANEGSYSVKLTVSNAKGSHTSTIKNYLTVLPSVSPKLPGWRATADWWYLNNWEQEGWRFENEFSLNTFQRVKASYNNSAGMMLPMDPANEKNSIANTFSFISPAFNFANTSKPYFAFNFAFARGTLFGNPTTEAITLYSSGDCGKSWIQRATYSGVSASTIGSSTLLSNVNFVPNEPSKWKEVVFEGVSFPKVACLIFKITFKYQGGNNFFLDNVRTGDGVANGIINPLNTDLEFSVSPNPLSGSATISYELKKKQEVKIQIFDLLGKEIGTLFNGVQLPGNQNVIIDNGAYNLKNGIYFVKMIVEDKSFTQKIIIE